MTDLVSEAAKEDFSEQDEVAETIPCSYFKFLTDRRSAVLLAKRHCMLGASMAEIDNLATAIERRRDRIRRSGDEHRANST